jgi:hypothetical protein
VCPLRGQSLESRLAVQAGVVQIAAVGPSRRVEVLRNRQQGTGQQSLTLVADVFAERALYGGRIVVAASWSVSPRHQLGQARGE